MQISFAARGILNKLNEKFYNKNFLFAEFYDFERGLEPYFKRRLSQVPMEHRGKNWISIMWSRDPQQQSWNNKQYSVNLSSSSLYSQNTAIRYAYCSIVFSYISNSMDYLESCEKQFFSIIPDGFTTMFDNVPYNEWNANQKIQEGWYRIGRRYNGRVYQCVQSGVTGNSEPEWKFSQEVSDGSVVWKPIDPPIQLKVQFDNVATTGLQKYDLDTSDSLCKIDIGGRMFLPLILDEFDPNTGEILGDSSGNASPILYPRANLSTYNRYPEYEAWISPTPEHWENTNG